MNNKPISSGSGVQAAAEPMVRCAGVHKVFGNRLASAGVRSPEDVNDDRLAASGLVAAVRDVNLEIERGEVFAVMGLSGSGKSTLVRCMAGLMPISFGQIEVNGTNLAELSSREMVEVHRHTMAMVFQDFALLPHLSVLGNVAFPLKVQGMERKQRDSRAREMIELVGLAQRENYYPHELSGGQQQRVGIARSLTTRPQIWFLDEPFSALDPLIRAEMQDELIRLQGLLQKTIVFITHDFEEAIRVADRIALMQEGRVIQVGSPEELVLNPATEYVRQFTAKIPRSKVLTAGVLAETGNVDAHAPEIAANERINEIAGRVLDYGAPCRVLTAEGRVIGRLTPKAVTAALLGRPHKSENDELLERA